MASYDSDFYPSFPSESYEIFSIVGMFFITLGIFYAVISILAIVGGIFALKKKMWGLALTGSIAGTITFLPTGIPAIIFVTLAKEGFSAQRQPNINET